MPWLTGVAASVFIGELICQGDKFSAGGTYIVLV